MNWWKKMLGREERPDEVEAFDKWALTTQFLDGARYDLHGQVWSGNYAEALRYVEALRDGLRAAGFDAELTLTRSRQERR